MNIKDSRDILRMGIKRALYTDSFLGPGPLGLSEILTAPHVRSLQSLVKAVALFMIQCCITFY